MTTLDPIDAVLDKLTIESAKELGNGYVVYARGMAYVIDAVRAALSSLPAQAVGEAEIEAAARAINPVAFQVDPPHAKDSDAKRMMRAIARNQAQDALTAAALVHRDQVKL